MSDRSSIFDMIGPVMIGPSSSHTAGVVRIGRVARRVLGCQPEHATITFYNSFAQTFEGHGSDKAVIGGLLDFKTDDAKIKTSLAIAEESILNYTFRASANASALHPNTIKIEMTAGERTASIIGVSRGGGLISIVEIDKIKCNFTAQAHTLIIDAKDKTGSIAYITAIIANDECNIATMTVGRSAKNADAKLVFELDSGLKPISIEYLQNLSWVNHVLYIPDIDL